MEMSDIATKQMSAYAPAIGRGVSVKHIDNVRDRLKAATRHPAYESHTDVPFVYEILEFDGWHKFVQHVADAWIADPANIARALSTVNRELPIGTTRDSLLCGSCICRLKKHKGGWEPTSKEHGLQIHMRHSETIVFIALEDLKPDNGFFISLKYAEDVCVDGRAEILFPAPGGGMCICLVLKI